MKRLKVYCMTIGIAMLTLSVEAQSVDNRVQLLHSFCQYIQQTPQQQWTKEQLESYIMASDSAWVTNSSQSQILQAALITFKQSLEGIDLARYDAVPWQQFSDSTKLPTMVWEAEPLTQLMGQPLPTGNREKELAEGRKQTDNTLVVFSKKQPATPLRYVLFDQSTGKIASWVLIKQGELHYFLFL